MPGIVIYYQGIISRALFLRAQRLHRGPRWLLFFLFPIMFAVPIWSAGSKVPGAVKVGATLIAVAFVPLMVFSQWWQWHRLFHRSPYLREPITGMVSEHGLRAENALGQSVIPWDRFTTSKAGRDLMLLYQGPHLLHVIAREFFVSEGEWEKARKLIDAHMHVSRV